MGQLRRWPKRRGCRFRVLQKTQLGVDGGRLVRPLPAAHSQVPALVSPGEQGVWQLPLFYGRGRIPHRVVMNHLCQNYLGVRAC